MRLFAMFYHENEYLNYHLTTIVNFYNFTFRRTILLNDVTSNWFRNKIQKRQNDFVFFQMLCDISKLSFVIIN